MCIVRIIYAIFEISPPISAQMSTVLRTGYPLPVLSVESVTKIRRSNDGSGGYISSRNTVCIDMTSSATVLPVISLNLTMIGNAKKL
jgi:hypothetical protein